MYRGKGTTSETCAFDTMNNVNNVLLQVRLASTGAPCVNRCALRQQVRLASTGAPCVNRYALRQQ
eukprot:8544775-Pyramimonas_sp.AAC.1